MRCSTYIKVNGHEMPLKPGEVNKHTIPHDICYGPTSGTTHSMDWANFSLFFLSYLIISDFEPWRDSLWELTYFTPFTISQTHVCLMANLILLNLTLFLTVHFHAVHGYAATHMHITHVLCFSSILPPPCGHIMLLISITYACPKQYQ